MGLIAGLAAAENRQNESPSWTPISDLPDGEQDTYYSYNLTATDPDNTFVELTFSDDADFFDIAKTDTAAEIAFIPSNEHVGYHWFNVTVEDPGGLSDTMELELIVVNVNDPPRILPIPDQVAYEDEVFVLNASDYVEDPDLILPPDFRDTLVYRDDSSKIDTNLETGQMTWDVPTNWDVGEHYVTLTVTDSKGRFDQREILITVINTNDPPEIGLMSKQVLHQDSPYQFTIPYEDDDLDVEGVDERLTFTNTHHELFVIEATTGRIQFTPENQHIGLWEVDITVTDLDGANDTRTVVFEVLNVNDPPEIEYIPVQQLTEDEPYELQVVATDPDLEPRLVDGSPVDPDEAISFRTNLTSIPIDAQTGLISLTPTNEMAVLRFITCRITVIDASAETYSIDVTFEVQNVNDPPENVAIIGLIDGQMLRTEIAYQLTAHADDIDNTADELTFTWSSDTAGVIGYTQEIVWTPHQPGDTEITMTVTDPYGMQSSHSVTVGVKAIVLDPAVEVTSPAKDSKMAKGEAITFDLEVDEEVFPPLSDYTIKLHSDKDGLIGTFSPLEDITIPPDTLSEGEHNITITVTSNGLEVTTSVHITVGEKATGGGGGDDSPSLGAAATAVALAVMVVALATRRRR